MKEIFYCDKNDKRTLEITDSEDGAEVASYEYTLREVSENYLKYLRNNHIPGILLKENDKFYFTQITKALFMVNNNKMDKKKICSTLKSSYGVKKKVNIVIKFKVYMYEHFHVHEIENIKLIKIGFQFINMPPNFICIISI